MSYQNGELGHCYDDSNAENRQDYASGYAEGYKDWGSYGYYRADPRMKADYVAGYSHGFHAARSLGLAESQINGETTPNW